MEIKKFDLEDRLVKFACSCLHICELLPSNKACDNLEYQLSKSCTASALIYGEAQAAESTADFIHKMKMTLKEIRETRVNLRIIIEKPFLNIENTKAALKEADELIAIFLKSITTAKHRTIRQGSPTYSFLIFHFLFFIFTDIFSI